MFLNMLIYFSCEKNCKKNHHFLAGLFICIFHHILLFLQFCTYMINFFNLLKEDRFCFSINCYYYFFFEGAVIIIIIIFKKTHVFCK